MEGILRRQEEKLRAGEVAVAEDAEFHYSVALASDNSVVLKVIDILMDLLRDTRERSLQVEGRGQKSLAGHLRILAAIRITMARLRNPLCAAISKMSKRSCSTGSDSSRIPKLPVRLLCPTNATDRVFADQ